MQQAKLAIVVDTERRRKVRFPLERDLRYKVLKDDVVLESGNGQTVNMSSGGVAFSLDHDLPDNCYIELAISWPVLLQDTTPMRLFVFGRVLRSGGRKSVCSIEKYEFRTQSRGMYAIPMIRTDSKLQRWADGLRRETVRTAAARA
jgi:hypothetical protein